MAEKNGRYFRFVEAIKKELVAHGVKPEVLDEAYKNAINQSYVIRGCPTKVSKTIGGLLKDQEVSKIVLYRESPSKLKLVGYKGKRKGLTNTFTPENWSVKRFARETKD